jgi:hypothetical protein
VYVLKGSGKLFTPSRETIYKALGTNRLVVDCQREALQRLEKKMKQLKIRSVADLGDLVKNLRYPLE